MSRKDQIKSAYRFTGGHASLYDGMMTYSTLPGKAICRLVWNMDGEKNLRYLEQALSGVPENFSGSMLEVPVGTGVLTMPVYHDLPKAEITCLDYSPDMMAAARSRAELAGIKNITFRQGDVGNLPFEDEQFDIVLSLNGFHAFPDKDAAYQREESSADVSTSAADANGRTGLFRISMFPKGFSHHRLRQKKACANVCRRCTKKSR